MTSDEQDLRPRMHLVNRHRWRTGSSGRPLTARRGSSLGLLEGSARPTPTPGPSTTDELVIESASGCAQDQLGRVGRRAARTDRQADRLAARAAQLRARAADLRAARLLGSSGAAETPEVRLVRHEKLAATVTGALDRGEGRHRRAGRGARLAARLLPWVDALLFGYFVAGISNADLARPWTTPVASFVAVAFTAFLVLAVAVFTPWLGHGLRAYKGPSGQLRFAEIGAVATGLLGLWGVLVLAIALTMFARVVTEARYAGAEPFAGTAVAVLLALAAVAMTGYVLVVAIADGSPESDELRLLGRSLARTEARARRLERRAARWDARRARAVRAAVRREAAALVRAHAGLTGADRTVDLVRLRTGVPADRPRPARRSLDDLDHREMDVVRDHLATAPFE